jgi:hypothetical protein
LNSSRARNTRGDLAEPVACPASRRPFLPFHATLLHERNVIVLADTLKHEEGYRAIPSIGDEVRAARSD